MTVTEAWGAADAEKKDTGAVRRGLALGRRGCSTRLATHALRTPPHQEISMTSTDCQQVRSNGVRSKRYACFARYTRVHFHRACIDGAGETPVTPSAKPQFMVCMLVQVCTLPPSLLLSHDRASLMEAQDILANIAFTTSGALVDCVDSMFQRKTAHHRKSDCRVA